MQPIFRYTRGHVLSTAVHAGRNGDAIKIFAGTGGDRSESGWGRVGTDIKSTGTGGVGVDLISVPV